MEDDSSDDSCERLVDYRKTSTTTAAAAGNNSNNHKIREKKESAKEKTANEEEEDNDCAKNDDGNNNDPHNNQSSSSDGDDDDDDDEYWDPRQRPQPSVAASEAASHRNQKRRRRPAAATAPSHKKPKPRKKRVRQRVGLESRDMEENADTNNTANVFIPKHITVEQMIQTVGFCCAECYCNGDRGATRVWTDTDFGQSQTDGYYHRLCCHKTTVQAVRASEGTWCTMYDGANQDAFANMMSSNEALTRTSSCLSLVEEEQLRPRIESECCDDLDDTGSIWMNTKYRENHIKFDSEKKRTHAVVLDVFAGIGSTILALKRAGVAVNTIIHVEHDKIASHVYKWNHDQDYIDRVTEDLTDEDLANERRNVDGKIKHVYLEKFEELENGDTLESILNEYGPIDIVLGGPPCVDYSLANAQRQGVSGLQGSYMIRFGNLVTKIRHMQRDHHVYFLAENVRIDNEKELPLDAGQLTAIEKAFGVSWNFKLDAKLYSPLRRLRMFFTNITADVAEYYEMKDKPVHQCLEDDFNHCACIDGHEPRARHNCFMAHQGRVNDDRMIVYKRDGNGMIERRFLSVTEREAMMGYPKGYVKNPVEDLFNKLLNIGHSPVPARVGDGSIRHPYQNVYWKDHLPEEYHKFGGKLHKIRADGAKIRLEMATPRTGATDVFYNQDQYAKRLIGNAISAPVLDIFFQKLKEKFDHFDYTDYSYDFSWTKKGKSVDSSSTFI